MATYPLLTKETFDPDKVWAFAKARGAKEPRGVAGATLRYLKALKADAATLGISGRWMVAQWDLETGNPSNGNGGQSAVWVSTGNPGGIAVFPDGSTWGLTFTPEVAARAQVTHMARYLDLPNVPASWIATDARWDVPEMIAMVGDVTNVQDLGGGRWATNDDYADQLIGRYTKYFGKPGKAAETSTPAPLPTIPSTGGSTVTTFTKHTFPGLPNPVYLPDWIPVSIKLIPSSTPGWTSGQKVDVSQFTSTTYHDTQNDLSSAQSEYTWAKNGGRASINSAGSYNGIFDANGLIITQRFDELVGHAANPTGNVTSYAFEEAYGATGHAASLDVGLWVHAGVLQAMGKSGGTESMYLHQWWSGKYCSKQILDRGQWSYAEQTVDARVAEINAYLKQSGDGTGGPTTPPPTTTYAKPVPIPELVGFSVNENTTVPGVVTRDGGDAFIFTADLYECVTPTPRLQYADVKNSPRVGEDLVVGEKFIGAWLVKARDGEWYIVTPYWTRILLKDVKRIGDVPNLAAGAA